MIKRFLKRSETLVGCLQDIRNARNILRRFYRALAVKAYLDSTKTKKLQIGSGPKVLNSWLCTDISPHLSETVYLDATKPFPFSDSTFDYVFCEHMIEHIPYEKGVFMLRECHRILKPSGTIRISTPDLGVLLGLYNSKPDSRQAQYIKWITDQFLQVRIYRASLVINNAFRNWNHQFLYDSDLLQMVMKEAGFDTIRRQMPGESDDENLKGLEMHGKNIENEEMNAFETMVFEGRCRK